MSRDTYTADTNSLLYYIADVLPAAADSIYEDALNGAATILLPPIAAAEAAYILENRETISGVTLRADGADLVAALDNFLPVTVTHSDMNDLRSMVAWLSAFPKQIHDALILASHEARDTDAIITSDPKIQNTGVPTVWE
jgi:predicted nucleic acid-binding protein